MNSGPLLAKSHIRNDLGHPATLVDHAREVLEAADAVWEGIETDLAASLAIDATEVRATVKPLLQLAAILHDVGKANSAFQQMVRAEGSEFRQPVRHEILSALALTDATLLGKWLSGALSEQERWLLIWAIAGHHLKMGDPARGSALYSTAGTAKSLSLLLGHSQIADLLRLTAGIKKADIPAKLGNVELDPLDDGDEGLEQRINLFVEQSARAWNQWRKRPGSKERLGLLKALLIAADVAGSALPFGKNKPREWIRYALAHRITPEALAPVIQEGTSGNKPHPFQERVGEASTSATVVIAGCGNGKTTAAYLWARKWANGRKLFFTYPTTGTASAGYEDYLFGHKAIASALIHGRAEVDRRIMEGTPEDERIEAPLRLEALQTWDRQVVVCTVDTVLGLLGNQRRSLYAFPAIVSGAFVFDEIHSYDRRLFGALLRFLQTFPGVPVLLMSASIPPARMAILERVLGSRLGEVITGDPTAENIKRYRLEPRESKEACQQDVRTALQDGKKVLWVCNTVKEAVETAREAKQWSGLAESDILIYHSRFRYGDRVNRQQEVITAFEYNKETSWPWARKVPGGKLVITTQVCEMSLDLSADLLVSAECPLPSLVQRLGRLNRYARSDSPAPCLVFPFRGDPYNENPALIQTRGDYRSEMAACRSAVAELAGRPCSQRDLADRLNGMSQEEEFETYSAWLDDGWLTEPSAIREGDQTITVVREEDLPQNRQNWTRVNLVRLAIPMLARRHFEFTLVAGGYPVATSGTINYCEREGAEWR